MTRNYFQTSRWMSDWLLIPEDAPTRNWACPSFWEIPTHDRNAYLRIHEGPGLDEVLHCI